MYISKKLTGIGFEEAIEKVTADLMVEKFGVLTEIDVKFNLSKAYVGRAIRLTNLAPQIIEMVINGTEPDGLTQEMLTKRMPVIWGGQMRELGFDEDI